MKNKLILFVGLFILPIIMMAQSIEDNLSEGLRGSNKLYVVISVLLTIYIGIIVFLFIIEKRLKKLEK